MKSTNERLAKSYCRPQTEEEWVSLIGYAPAIGHTLCAWSDGFGAIEHENHLYWMTTEIPVSHFIDLIHDRLAPWRLEEDGFTTLGGSVYSKRFTIDSEDGKITRTITVITDNGRVYLNDGATNVSTYTQLLTLIQLIG
jgi:hypothetical protein